MSALSLPFPITTPRLVLRPPIMDDVPAIHAAKAAMWPDLQKWMSWASAGNASYVATEKYVSDTRPRFENGVYQIPLIGLCRETGRFVVSTGLHPSKDQADGYPQHSTGYWVAKEFQGCGMATEATHAVLRYAFEVCRVPSVGISYFDGNAGSRRVIEKLGFTFLKTVANAHTDFLEGQVLDEHHYVMHKLELLH